jgi:DNA-binding beta-propeller fold protein YncE
MRLLKRKPNLSFGAAFLVLLGCLWIAQNVLEKKAVAQERGAVQAPAFEVDPLWPKPLPNHWLLGMTIGVSVDDQDHVWIIHRSSASLANNEKGLELKPPTGECCAGAPPVLEFDQAGNLLRHWGGPGQGYEWPDSNHGITIDYKGNVWIGGNGGPDQHILKFTKDGKFLLQIGKKGARTGPPARGRGGARSNDPDAIVQGAGAPTYPANSNDPVNFGRVAKIFVDPKMNEAYIGDGYLNKRVAVLDADTGKIKRYWGAYGNKPDDTDPGPYNPDAPLDQQFRSPVHCAELSNDRLLYVCDRINDRIQVFTPEGKFVKEMIIAKRTLSAGSTWDITFSKDAQQRFLFLTDGVNEKVHILVRDTLQEVASFGDGGRQPGQFFGVHSIATDSKGNLYTTETFEGKRVQRFVYKGLKPVTKKDQGAPWPASSGR